MYKHASAILVPLLVANSALSAGQETPPQNSGTEALRHFAQCDASFFNTLKKHPNTFGPSVHVANRGSAATIVVANPLSKKGNEQYFSHPPQINDLRLVAWHNEVSYDVDMGGFLYWGFKVDGDPTSVAKKINSLLPDTRKLVHTGKEWVRSEVRSIGDAIDTWHAGGISGTVTPRGSVERALIVEGESPSVTTVYCSIQGSITAPLLKRLRPDLLSSEYPQ
ncbi:hypothetical protein SAMN05660284_01915 [Formivibrio citricus]|uniref:Uncharacterized protein n=1 Tax=Formivibrio citricus TaxID=83765 RepID=A0A1I5AHL3_9NEIS|nr:hypothetical protein [Formivibrio citricus]SFN61925.1 hypothetical protein SAMN05660284_01915 [Formivibrio citricus]